MARAAEKQSQAWKAGARCLRLRRCGERETMQQSADEVNSEECLLIAPLSCLLCSSLHLSQCKASSSWLWTDRQLRACK